MATITAGPAPALRPIVKPPVGARTGQARQEQPLPDFDQSVARFDSRAKVLGNQAKVLGLKAESLAHHAMSLVARRPGGAIRAALSSSEDLLMAKGRNFASAVVESRGRAVQWAQALVLGKPAGGAEIDSKLNQTIRKPSA